MNGPRKKLLIVDDESSIRDSLRLLLKQNFEVYTVEDGLAAIEMVEKDPPHLILLDVMMPNLDGMETLRRVHKINPTIPVIMLTAANTVKTAVQAMKEGAVDYLSKPFDIDELTSLIINLLEDKEGTLESVAVPVRKEVKPETKILELDYGSMVGRSPAMKRVFEQINQVIQKDTTILVTGESGTGKELIAKEIHKRSKRRDAPFVALNCAAIPETLIESELFGHEKGSFTSAVESRAGMFELADGGTLFLDEIGELSLPVQVKLLRFLQEHEFYRIGRTKPIKVDLRLITATNRNLDDLIKEKQFRQDLYYRINVVNIMLPPLRDRYEDIPCLCEHFIEKLSRNYDDRRLRITPEAMDIFVQYGWPGNVRELENIIESLMALCPDEEICECHLPPKLLSRRSSDTKRAHAFDGSFRFEDAEKMFETEMILKALRKTNYVQTRAAELLGISRRILKYKMDKLGISEPAPDSAVVEEGK